MPQQAFGFRAGYPRADGFAVSVISLSNADLTIKCDGFSATISAGDWTQVGADHPTKDRLGYMASVIVTGQPAFTRVGYTVTQNGTTYSGSAMTAPRRGDDFSMYFMTCDANVFSLQESNAGGYAHIKSDYDAGKTVLGIIHVDDHYGYIDQINSVTLDDSAGTGHVNTGSSIDTGLEYDYAMMYFAAFGLFVNETGGAFDAWGQDETRIWAMRNINVLPQWGDHDAGANEMGWDIDPASVTGTPAPATQFTNSKTLWDLFMGPLQPPSIATLATTANHWGVTLGSVTIVSPDGITLGSGGATSNHTVDGFGPANVYTINQIDDCLNALNTDAPFKILGMNYGIKYLASGTKYFSGAQNPLKNGRPAEYQRLFTATGNTPPSIMDNPKTNGVQGTFVSLHGDYHVNKVQLNQAAAFTGNAAENFYSASVGTNNGSVNFGTGAIDVDTVADGTTVELIESASKGLSSNGGNDWWTMRIDIVDSVHPPTMTLLDRDKNGNTLWNKRFTQYRSMNYAYPVDQDVTAKGATITGETE